MRKLNLFLVAAMLLATGTIFANNGTLVDKPAKKLSAQIADLLKKEQCYLHLMKIRRLLFYL